MNNIYLLLGSNMGNSVEQITTARRHIDLSAGKIKTCSSLYQTSAWGNTDQPDFINQVILIQSDLTPAHCLQSILAIEKKMGRIRTVKNAPRIIDIDILYFNNDIINSSNLIVPHPAIADRRFVLTPLNEIAREYIHPVYGKTNHELLLQCKDNLGVKKIGD